MHVQKGVERGRDNIIFTGSTHSVYKVTDGVAFSEYYIPEPDFQSLGFQAPRMLF